MSTNLPKNYNPKDIEDKWYQLWMEKDYFHSEPEETRPPYTIVIPPPNVTGVLHMGHMLNNTIQDVLIRRARMLGYNACWVPGTDHASIATEAKVVAKLKDEGINKTDLSREEFLKHAWEWTHKHGGIILEQLKKLGASCDWKRTRFTMDDDYYKSVIRVFVHLYNKGEIYKGVRMINWDPVAKTALSDEEVIYKEVNSKLYYIRYKIEESDDEWITIATTRPETILGDTAVCVNPNDERYKHLKGKHAIVPLVNRKVPIIFDEYVDMEFGTGALKVTPAHDINDYELGIKHNLQSIDILNDDGTLSINAEKYVGEDRFKVREKIGKELEELGYLVKVEDIINKVGFSERTDAVIEPKLSLQWFYKMDKASKPALENVLNGNIKFYPKKFINTYKHWMENVHDWCISRQLWWGHQIPAYYYDEGPNDYVVAETPEEALKLAREKTGNQNLQISDLKQDEDVLDTWFSSWIWPIAVFNGILEPDNPQINYYYPTNDLVTAPEILFFWVARMIMAGYEFRGEKPFSNVYLTGIVRDKLGRKMSKSLGNSPDPIELINKYSADGVRVGMLLSSPAGNDLLFDEQLCEQGRNFMNKIWNALRLVKGWEIHAKIEQPEHSKIAIDWFENKFQETLSEINKNYRNYRISDVLMNCYRLVWDDFCSWYLEIVKPAYGSPVDAKTYNATIDFFEKLMQLLHPFTPFITEEIWHILKDRTPEDTIMFSKWPEEKCANPQIINDFNIAQEIIAEIRNFRKQKNIPHKDSLNLKIKLHSDYNKNLDPVIKKVAHVNAIDYVDESIANAYSFIVKNNEFFIPLSENMIDIQAEIKKIKSELEYTRGFLNSVMKKLSNEKFVQNAPEQVVKNEQKKKADAEAKIQMLEKQLESLTEKQTS
ncbi:MAG: valine--tRNA ligase [Bacteroidetes bacterium]|nr:MAG: valine--tRNA ligase [Bacteroidota bacterium]